MGAQMIRSFPWIDYVCCGEADHSFVALLDRLLRGHLSPSIPGVLNRQSCGEVARSEVVRDLVLASQHRSSTIILLVWRGFIIAR